MANNAENQVREYAENRFEFSLYVNENLICKRNFRISNYIEGSMQSINFKETVDDIVRTIDNDLKSKSRVYTWYYFNEDDILDEFKNPLLEPWECTFRFEVTDNKRLVMTRIWDGYAYPKSIREKVDIANKVVRINTRDGKTYTFDKETYFAENADRLTPEMHVMRAMIADKQDLLSYITRTICEKCSPREDSYTSIGDYTVSEVYRSVEAVRNEDGTIKKDKNGDTIFRKTGESRKYIYSVGLTNKKYISDWAQAVSEKTKKYFETLY